MTEKWKDVVGFENEYQVSSLGRVRAKERYVINNGGKQHRKAQLLKLRHNSTGYVIVGLRKNGLPGKIKKVHRLVATAFLNCPDLSLDVDHLDGNKDNNAVNNLQWVDRSENLRRAYKNNLRVSTFKDKPSRHRKLSEQQVKEARLKYAKGKSTTSIADELSLSQSATYDMLTGKTYRDVIKEGD